MFKLDLEKAEEPEIKLPISIGSLKIQEFQRIARRDKKYFLSDQCKEIQENNRMGKTRDLFKKIKRYQGNTSSKDGHNKGQKHLGHN